MNYRKEIVSQVVEFIENNIIEELSIDRLAAISGYSKWHLQRLFKKHIGIKIGTYIRHRRLSKSAILLKQSQGDILTVAVASGFSSQQCFTRAFKRFFGETPKKFRLKPEWDFSKQYPPFINNGELDHYYLSLPQDLGVVKTCHAFIYHSTCKDISIKDISNSHKKRVQGIFDIHCCALNQCYSSFRVMLTSDVFCSLNCLYLPAGKYLILPFRGKKDEYVTFYKNMYDKHLPFLNVKMKDGFVVELYPDDYSEELILNVEILVPII
jgi:AraC family transcriptional activator of mar-sox-rob regulon